MSDIEIMEFPYGAFLKVRLEFVLLRDNELEARIMRIIEGWMIDQKKAWMNECTQAASDGKPEPLEPDYYVTLSYAQITAQLYMFNSSRKGKDKEVVEGKKNSIHRNTITKAMSALIEDNYVITRPNPDKSKEYEATQYTLNLPLIQEHMKLLPKTPMSYLGSNGRIDGIECPDFFKPPKEIPCTKFVHGSKDAQKTDTPCTKNVHPTHAKSASPSTKKVHGDAQKSSHLIDRENRNINRINNRESTVDETATSPSAPIVAPSPSSLSSLSSEGETEAPSKEKTENPKTPPVMPHETAKWCAETVVQIVEARLNKRFLEVARGKRQKCQRERQLDAGKKIIDAKVTREEFIMAYDDRNDQWWNERNGELTVVEMAANTHNRVMRTLEVLENIEKRKPTGGRVIDITSRGSSEVGARPSFLVSEEKRQKNIAHVRALAAAKAAKE